MNPDTPMAQTVIDVPLNPCPLCKGSAFAVEYAFPGETAAQVAKVACGSCGCRITGPSADGLRERWNRRVY